MHIYLDIYTYVYVHIFTPLRVGWPPHTAGLFRSVRGAKGGFPPWGLFKLRSFNKKILPKHCFWQWFSNVSSQTDGNLHVFCHKGSKSFQNIAFDSVFVMFSSQAYGNLHVFCYNVSPKHLFLQCFQCSGIQKPCKILLCTMFFSFFGRFSSAGKLPKWPKIPFQYPLALRHPKILEKCWKHHRILVSVRNRFWGLVSVRNRFWAPPPAKADIATAILTNVIEHLVLLLPPNKHAFTAKSGVGGFANA